MKRVCTLLLLICAICVSSPAISKNSKKNKTKSYELPGTELILEKKADYIRAWAVGVADTETAARMLAMKNASSELAEMVTQSVESTLKNCHIVEVEGASVSSKEIVSKELQILAKEQLSGAVVIFDSWEPKNEEGMYKNYIVLELKGDKFIDKLYSDYEATTNDKRMSRKELTEAYLSLYNK